jgi:hypothetical protein
MVAHIWSYLTIQDLLLLSRTSRANHSLVRSAIKSTIYRLIAPFTTEKGVQSFLSVLGSQRSVISGSTALYPIISSNFSGTNRNSKHWLPIDMDIYEPRTSEPISPIIKYMIDVEGFRGCGEKVHTPNQQYITPCGIKRVYCLYKKKLRVDVVTSATASAITPIFHFHSTIVFNWISADGFFSAYPKLTCAHRGLTNPLSFTLNQFVPSLPPASTRSALMKYYKRGFDIRRNPGTTHNIVDKGTMFISFADDSHPNDKSRILPYDNAYILFWYLGGPACGGQQRVCDSYIAYRADAEDERIIR